VTDQLGHFRVAIGLARIHWYREDWVTANGNLRRAPPLTYSYNCFVESCSDFVFIYLFQSLVLKSLSTKLLDIQPTRYYVPGIGTYFFKELCKETK
jgi:hypothetical protein